MLARWTSPLLYYYETFHPVVTGLTAEAVDLVTSVGMVNCTTPIVFAVTNFDPGTRLDPKTLNIQRLNT